MLVAVRLSRHVVAMLCLVALANYPAYAADAPSSTAPELRPTGAAELRASLQADMRRASGDGNWHGYLTAARRQKDLLNEYPRSRLEVARAEAHLGHADAALAELRAFVRAGQSSDVLRTSPDFAKLRGTADFAAILNAAADNDRPISRSSLAFRLKDRGLLPEDIDYEARNGRFYISSIMRKKIVTATAQGDVADFAMSPDGWPVMALKIDHARRLLWASEVALEDFAGVEKSDQGRSAILCYDLQSGKLLRRIEGPRPSALGDIALTVDGAVIASDGAHGAVYRVGAGDRMQRIDAGDFISPQTAAMESDGARVIIPDYLRGLGLLTIATKKVTWLSSGGQYALSGIDGLYRAGNRLIAVQNGTEPERVVIFAMDAAGTKIAAEDILERSTPTLGDPTHGVIVGDVFYYIANSGWDVLDDHGKVEPGKALTEPLVMKVVLNAR